MDRLGKFFALVKNEYIKIYKKTSSRILLIIFFAVCLCFAPIARVINNIGMKEAGTIDYDYSSIMRESLNDNKEELENNPDIPFHDEKLALIDAVDLDSDWQVQAANSAMYAETKQTIQTYTMFCKTNDWRGYCKYKAELDGSDGEKWAAKYRLEHDISYDEFNEQDMLLNNIASMMENEYGDLEVQEKVTKLRYQLENGIYEETSGKVTSILDTDYSDELDFWDVMMKIPYIESFIGIIMIMIAGGIVSSEFGQGTIKFLLISPVQRGKILMAKYFTVVSLGFLLMLMMFVVNIPMIGLFFGFDGISAPYLMVKNDEVAVMNSFMYLIRTFMLKSVQVMIYTSLAFMISSLARSSALAIVTGFILSSVDTALITVMAMFKMDWGRYLIFANTDLLNVYNGGSPFPQQTVGAALIVVVAHLAVFLLTAWDGFTRRSV